MDITKIQTKVRTGEKLTKKEDEYLEYWENTHTDFEFNCIIGTLGEITPKDKAKIFKVCITAIENLGYTEIDIS